jgi:hydroxymethylglutaryl-CoA lyase
VPEVAATTTYPRSVKIREVGPRDGLQVEAPVDPTLRAALVQKLLDAGVSNIEVASFVSEKAVPAMAGAAAVIAQLQVPNGVAVAALVPNARGAEMALDCGVDQLTVTISASQVYSERNVHMTVDQSLEQVITICGLASREGVPVDAVVSCSFGSPYEGDIPPAEIKELAGKLEQAGASAITLADTTGMGTPRVISDVLSLTGTDVGLHLHDTRGTGLLNLYSAIECGVTRFDTAIGGLGGSPFAKGAGGTVATEDVVALLDDLGIETGISLAKLIEASRFVEELVGHPVASRVALAGPRLPSALR